MFVDSLGVWLSPNLSLSEQSTPVKHDAVLELSRRLHYYDTVIDRSDSVALSAAYNESRTAIMRGIHPVTREEAVQFAAMCCQIMHGNYDVSKQKKGAIQYVYDGT